ncbi:hypothetical protein SESBI_03362 [Sesbania bispinosa]|nr:hypothetical protein SESBI_03362 [Sesbania bispinosa]
MEGVQEVKKGVQRHKGENVGGSQGEGGHDGGEKEGLRGGAAWQGVASSGSCDREGGGWPQLARPRRRLTEKGVAALWPFRGRDCDALTAAEGDDSGVFCVCQVDMLAERNKSYRTIKFVDISSDDYSPEDNQGLDYETDEVVKLSPYARAIRDVEDEELWSFFYGMSPWKFILMVAASSVGEELFYRVAVQVCSGASVPGFDCICQEMSGQ